MGRLWREDKLHAVHIQTFTTWSLLNVWLHVSLHGWEGGLVGGLV
jgi:hypothetical protein